MHHIVKIVCLSFLIAVTTWPLVATSPKDPPTLQTSARSESTIPSAASATSSNAPQVVSLSVQEVRKRFLEQPISVSRKDRLRIATNLQTAFKACQGVYHNDLAIHSPTELHFDFLICFPNLANQGTGEAEGWSFHLDPNDTKSIQDTFYYLTATLPHMFPNLKRLSFHFLQSASAFALQGDGAFFPLFRKLSSIHLHGCLFNAQMAHNIGRCKNLKHLTLGATTTLMPGCLAPLNQIQKLVLACDLLPENAPELASLTNLRTIKGLYLNGHMGLTATCLPLSLTSLHIAFVDEESAQGLGSLQGLKTVHLRGINQAVVEQLQRTPSLKTLCLDDKAIAPVKFTPLNASNLRVLKFPFSDNMASWLDVIPCYANLRHLQIHEQMPANVALRTLLQSAHALETLALQKPLTEDDMHYLTSDSLPCLRQVTLEHCALTDSLLAIFQGNTRLKKLFLSNNLLTDACQETLMSLKGLIKLHLSSNAFSSQVIQELKNALPTTNIITSVTTYV
ncbi:MAG: hypothetical protein ACPG7U_01780 [Holosporaceae bacterium]